MIFAKYIMPHLYPFPQYFAGLVFLQENDYWLVSKTWARVMPNLSDLLYYYHIKQGQPLSLCDGHRSGPPRLLPSVDERMCTYIDRCDENNVGNLILTYKQAIKRKSYDPDMVASCCFALIKKRGIYYFADFRWLLEERYHDIWLECLKEALVKGKADKRDHSLIFACYEKDLRKHIRQGNRPSCQFLKKFHEIKELNCKPGDDVLPSKSCSIELILLEQFERNTHALRFIFNHTYNILTHPHESSRGLWSYEKFRSEPIVKAFFNKEENANFLCDLFYKEFHKKYIEWHSKIDYADLDSTSSEKFFDLGWTYQKDFLTYTKPRVLDIIAHKLDSDQDLCLLFVYARLVFRLKDINLGNSFDAYVSLIHHFPQDFNSKIEDSSLKKNINFQQLINLQKFLGKIRRKQSEEQVETFYHKFVSSKKIIFYLLRYEKWICFTFLAMIALLIFLLHKPSLPTLAFASAAFRSCNFLEYNPFDLFKLFYARFVY